MSSYCPNIDPQKFYSVSEVAEMLGCTTECVREKIKKKKLLAARIGNGNWRISGDSLRKLCAPLEILMLRAKVATTKELEKRMKAFFKD